METRPLSASITDLRARKRWTQAELADHAGVPQTTVSNWERGGLDHQVGRLRKLAGAFGVSLGELVGDEAPTTLEPGQFVVDLDAYDAALAGRLAAGDVWYQVVPPRPQVCGAHQFAKLDHRLRRR